MEVNGRLTFGGMEKAFSAEMMMRAMQVNEYYAGLLSIDSLRKSSQTTEQRRKRKRTCRRSGNRAWGPWNFLPNELLDSIMLKLNIIDFFAFSGICRSWRRATMDFRKYYMERQQPLVVVRSVYTKRACILYNIFDGKEYKAMLPDLRSRPFVGVSSGYLITTDKNMGFWLVNLMTRNELRFLVLPTHIQYIDERYIRPVLFQSTMLSRVFMVLFIWKQNWLLLSESSASSWKVYLLSNGSAGISDVRIFNGKIFVLTCNAHICEFNPGGFPALKVYNTNVRLENPSAMSLQLVTSENKLFMIISCCQEHPFYHYRAICELDDKMQFVKWIHDFGTKSLFLSRFNASLVDTAGWGAGNCVCVLEANFLNRWSLFNLNGNKLASAPVIWDALPWDPYFWYFPNESCDIICVDDEFVM